MEFPLEFFGLVNLIDIWRLGCLWYHTIDHTASGLLVRSLNTIDEKLR